jgi:hypothetical protein
VEELEPRLHAAEESWEAFAGALLRREEAAFRVRAGVRSFLAAKKRNAVRFHLPPSGSS